MRARLTTQACEACRRRKVKCDAVPPQCSNCRALGLDCEYSTRRKKRGPKPRTRSGLGPGDVSSSEAITSPVPRSPGITSEVVRADLLDRDLAFSPSSHRSQDFRNTPQSSIGFSPLTDQESICSPRALEPDHRPIQIHQALCAAFEAMCLPLEKTVYESLDNFMLSHFPSLPMIHPYALKKNVRLLLPSSRHLFEHTATNTESVAETARRGADMRAFALLTAVCAIASCRSRRISTDLPMDATLAPFLSASRHMLACFEDWDIAHADSSSLFIRSCHSGALHHLGQTRQSWYILGDALRLAIDMRLYDESSYHNLSPLETKLRKNIFISLSMSAKSASVLNNRPTIFHEICLNESVTTPTLLEDEFSLLDPGDSRYDQPYEKQLHVGFYLSYRLWTMATDILLDMKTLSRLYKRSGCDVPPQDPVQMGIMHSYMDFCGILDTLPPWLRGPDCHAAGNEAATDYQRRTFWHQRANIVITFHCLRLILLRRAMEKGFCMLLGLTSNPDMLALRKIEIASDLAAAAASTPFEALHANGEPLVEKLRQVGVSLLEIVHQNVNDAVSSRAQSLLSTLIDIIARLDSRVSDELSGQPQFDSH
ncbi:hypothetical protein BGZ61DRAFT_473857 [Ilyonectria robusta]|uniref:uncharacterized protein n=1 Tax=Ilyonectria robusta TaxID=1079257 RepID=UPI001E8E664C|nr:uncharacterized protein BGZ61DRAFT_473857 [Ilyonectria robusta]KAH8735247.1 hypothetical protein BGZ61DRAFT_473857 [Ilyonectria robusta]